MDSIREFGDSPWGLSSSGHFGPSSEGLWLQPFLLSVEYDYLRFNTRVHEGARSPT